RAAGVTTVTGRVRARHAVVAAVTAPVLDRLAPGWRSDADARADEPGPGTVKVDWALSTPVPWSDPAVGGAGTVHVAPTLDELSVAAHQLARGVLPARPFLVMGQMTTADPTRSPAGTESAWAYTHVPNRLRLDELGAIRGDWGTDDLARF